MKHEIPDTIKDLSLEEAMQRLEEITARMEEEKIPLSEQVKLYQEGKALESLCQKLLSKATEEIEILRQED